VTAAAQVLRSSLLFELMLALFVFLLVWFEVEGCAEACGVPDWEVRRLLLFQRRSFAAFKLRVRSSIWGTVDGGWLLRSTELRATGRRRLGERLTKNSCGSRGLDVNLIFVGVLSARMDCTALVPF